MHLIHIGAGQYRYGSTVVTRDWDYPSLATRLGWSIRRVQRRGRDTRFLKAARKSKNNCEHSHTDGTIDCPDCGVKAIAFIEAASGYLLERSR